MPAYPAGRQRKQKMARRPRPCPMAVTRTPRLHSHRGVSEERFRERVPRKAADDGPNRNGRSRQRVVVSRAHRGRAICVLVLLRRGKRRSRVPIKPHIISRPKEGRGGIRRDAQSASPRQGRRRDHCCRCAPLQRRLRGSTER